MTCGATPSAISSPELVVGHSPCSMQAGQKTNPLGLVPAHVSLSVLPDDKKVKQMTAIYGQSGRNSLPSANLQSYLENRLRTQLPTGGLTMFMKGWKRKATPSGRLFYQLAVLAGRTSAKDYSLWATPNTMDYMTQRSQEAKDRQFSTTRKGRTAPANLREQVDPAMWPTPTCSDMKPESIATQRARNARMIAAGKTKGCGSPGLSSLVTGFSVLTGEAGLLNPAFPCWLMGFPTAALSSMVLAMQSYCKPQRRSSKRQSKEEVKP